MNKKITITYDQAKAWAIKAKINSGKAWRVKRPKGYPSEPDECYKKNWISWMDFLDKTTVSGKVFLDYGQAKAKVAKLGIKTAKMYHPRKTADLPSNPNKTYASSWTGWKDFFGTRANYLPYNDAKEFMKRFRLNGYDEFRAWVKTSDRPRSIPKNPYIAYGKSWKGWVDFLDTKPFSYREAKAFAIKSPIGLVKNWTKKGFEKAGVLKTAKIRLRLPYNYGAKYEGAKVFLGRKPLVRYDVLRRWIRPRRFRSAKEYIKFVKSYRVTNVVSSKRVPAYPDKHVYSQWSGWRDFLSK